MAEDEDDIPFDHPYYDFLKTELTQEEDPQEFYVNYETGWPIQGAVLDNFFHYEDFVGRYKDYDKRFKWLKTLKRKWRQRHEH